MVDTMDPDPRRRLVGAKARISQIDGLLREETNPKKSMALKAERVRCKKMMESDVEMIKKYYSHSIAA